MFRGLYFNNWAWAGLLKCKKTITSLARTSHHFCLFSSHPVTPHSPLVSPLCYYVSYRFLHFSPSSRPNGQSTVILLASSCLRNEYQWRGSGGRWGILGEHRSFTRGRLNCWADEKQVFYRNSWMLQCHPLNFPQIGRSTYFALSQTNAWERI